MQKIKFVRLVVLLLSIGFYSRQVFSQNIAISGEYIVKFRVKATNVQVVGKAGLVDADTANKSAAEKGERIVTALKGIGIREKIQAGGMLHIDSVTPEKLKFLESHPDVEYVEPNYLLSLDPKQMGTSQDEADEQAAQNAFEAQAAAAEADNSGLGVTAGASDSYTQSAANVQVTNSWAIEKPVSSTAKVTVAVVDSGLDLRHVVFANSGSIWQNMAEVNGITGVDDDNNGYIDDINGWNFVDGSSSMYDDNEHGTHVAGIVLGVGQDIFKFPVRESKVRIMPLKFLDANGSGSTSSAISAIYYAVNNGAKVINNSWGGPSYSRSLHDAYKYAYDRGVVLVTAAGNSNADIASTPMYPAALDAPSNITVAASTSSDRKASFSNYNTSLVHVFAPGYSIRSTVPSGSDCYSESTFVASTCFYSLSGTSMAAPFVAGLAALAIREMPSLSAYTIRNLILTGIDTSSYFSPYVSTGGRVNALKVIQGAQGYVVSSQSPSPVYNPVYKLETGSSSGSSVQTPAGCGLVKAVAEEISSQQGPPSAAQMVYAMTVIALMAAPVLLAVGLRTKKKKVVRQHARYSIAKQLMIQIGDQVIQSASETLSVGGMSFSSDIQVTKGQKIKVKIADSNDEVEGEIVWSSESNSFGVKFTNITDSLKSQIQNWSTGMVPLA